jgi:type III secretion protein C
VRLLTSLIAAALLAVAAPAPAAAAAPFASKKFVYRADGKKLAEVLQDFAATQGLPIVIDPGVEGTVNASFDTRPEEFLNAMTKTYGVIWYHDGSTLYVYPASAMQSRVFRMRGFDRQQVRQMLASLGLGDARFPLRFDDGQQTLLASGPPRHIELVSTVLDQLERGNRDRVGKAIQVFPLRYATAADRVVGASKVPGLATTLNQLFAANAGAGAASAGLDAFAKQTADSTIGKLDKRTAEGVFGIRSQPGAGGPAAAPPAAAPRNAPPAADPGDAEKPFFQAEEASNSIIVRGQPERMKDFETLIRQLDAPQDLVEIEATIIDVSTDEFDSLGVDWNFSRDGTTRFSLSAGAPPQGPGGTLGDTLAGANITTVLGNAGRQLLARVRALEGNGKARILARPKVLGAVNRMASMVDKRVASVRVAGNLDANLFTVEAGTTLQVTPQIVPYDDHREVRLTLSIQDGSFEGNVVDQVPIVKRTEINTEATIREGESLLIGGISVESDSKGRSAVPGLSRIPLVGGAFRHDEGESHRSERLFLLTPKVINVGGTRQVANAAARPALTVALPASAAWRAPVTVAIPLPVPAPSPAPYAAPATPYAVSQPTVTLATLPAPASLPLAPAAGCAAQALGLAAGCGITRER